MGRYLVFLLFTGFIFSSCVQNKQILYLQSEDELDTDFPTDTVLRSYDLANYEYRIQPEDILSIRVESLTEDEYDIFAGQQNVGIGNQANLGLSGYLVDKKGNIRIQEIGNVYIGGMTLHEVEQKITDLLSSYMPTPSVKIRLLNFRVTVLGEVNSEGLFQSINTRVTLTEAIASSGGLTDLADREALKIIRRNGDLAKIFYVNLLEENLLSNKRFFLHPNDVIIVPPLKQRPFRKYFGQNLSLFVSTVSLVLLTLNLLQ